ncbi:MAG: alpha-amylase C-terminal beta-sheet domain-containing protein [Gemmataceae bacterium]
MHTEIQTPGAVVMPMPAGGHRLPEPRTYHGDGRDVILQGFHWHSHAGVHDTARRNRRSWYRILENNAPGIQNAGFTWVWMPPPSDSLAPQGYIPRRWNVFDTHYGSEAELRSAIAALGPVRAMADVVLNHRVGVHTGGADFADPPFRDNRAAIVRDDESGVGTGNPDTGERHPAGRDLDHTNPDVRHAVKEYLKRLQSVGFQGWRYDLVKGFHGRYIAEYNDATNPGLSVGECFDGCRQHVTDWIDSTGGKSTAFDFPLRYTLYYAVTQDSYGGLKANNGNRVGPNGVMGYWASRAVTFLDNHDTEYRREHDNQYENHGAQHFPGGTVETGYAYLMTHPGIPCVFWSHLFDWGEPTRRRIERLIDIRRSAGVHSASPVDIREASRGLYAATIDGRVAVKLGTRDWHPGSGWHLAADGYRFAVWTR